MTSYVLKMASKWGAGMGYYGAELEKTKSTNSAETLDTAGPDILFVRHPLCVGSLELLGLLGNNLK